MRGQSVILAHCPTGLDRICSSRVARQSAPGDDRKINVSEERRQWSSTDSYFWMVRSPAPRSVTWQVLHSLVSTQAPWAWTSVEKALDQGDRDLYLGRRGEIVCFKITCEITWSVKEKWTRMLDWLQVLFPPLTLGYASLPSSAHNLAILGRSFFICKIKMTMTSKLLGVPNGSQFAL